MDRFYEKEIETDVEELAQFKAKERTTREWVTGNLVREGDCWYIVRISPGTVGHLRCGKEIDPSTICRFTGRMEWENDIIEVIEDGIPQRYVVEFSEKLLRWTAACPYDTAKTCPLSDIPIEYLTIVGNIIDNPKLVYLRSESAGEGLAKIPEMSV